MMDGYLFEARKTDAMYRPSNIGLPFKASSNLPVMIGVIIHLMKEGIVMPYNTFPDKSWIFNVFYSKGGMKLDNVQQEEILGTRLEFTYQLNFNYAKFDTFDTDVSQQINVSLYNLHLKELFYIILYNSRDPSAQVYTKAMDDNHWSELLKIINIVKEDWIAGIYSRQFTETRNEQEEMEKFIPSIDKKHLQDGITFPMSSVEDYDQFEQKATDLRDKYLSSATWMSTLIACAKIERKFKFSEEPVNTDLQIDGDFIQGIIKEKVEQQLPSTPTSSGKPKKPRVKKIVQKTPVTRSECEEHMQTRLQKDLSQYEEFLKDSVDSHYEPELEFDKDGLFLNYLRQIKQKTLDEMFKGKLAPNETIQTEEQEGDDSPEYVEEESEENEEEEDTKLAAVDMEQETNQNEKEEEEKEEESNLPVASPKMSVAASRTSRKKRPGRQVLDEDDSVESSSDNPSTSKPTKKKGRFMSKDEQDAVRRSKMEKILNNRKTKR